MSQYGFVGTQESLQSCEVRGNAQSVSRPYSGVTHRILKGDTTICNILQVCNNTAINFYLGNQGNNETLSVPTIQEVVRQLRHSRYGSHIGSFVASQ